MTDSRNYPSIRRVSNLGRGVLFAALGLSLSSPLWAETVNVNGMNDAADYANVDIVNTLGKAGYNHTGTITGSSSLTINAPETTNAYRQWLKGADGSYSFTGPITVNGGQLLIQSGTLKTKSIILNGGDMYIMYADCLPHDAVIDVHSGSMLDVEGAHNAIVGVTVNVHDGGSFRMAARNHNHAEEPITLNIAGNGTAATTGAIQAYGDNADIYLNAKVNLTDDAMVYLRNLSTNRQFIWSGNVTGDSTLTLKGDNSGRWIRMENLDFTAFSGDFVVDNVKARFFAPSLGTGGSITVQNSATAYFNKTAALAAYDGDFIVNDATISLETSGKLNNLSGNGSVTIGNHVLTLNNTKASTFSGVISGAGTVTKTGVETLTLSGENTYTGGTTVSAGTLKLGNLSAAGTGAVNIASGAVFEITAPAEESTWCGGDISGSGTLKVSGDGPFTIPMANFKMDGNAGKLVVDGADLTLNNLTNNTENYSGSDILIDNAGSLKFTFTGSANQIWLSNQTNITFGAAGGGTFNTGNSEAGLNFVNNSTTKFISTGGAANYISGTNGFNLHGQNITFDVAKGTAADGNDLIVSARLWNNHGIIKDGAGTMVLSATNSDFRGNVTINAGKIIASTQSSLGAVRNGKNVFVNEGAELSIGAQDVLANAHANNAVQFVVDGGKISNAGAVYNYLQNTTFKDGAELHAVDGNAVWKAFKLHNVNVLRNDDGSAAAPVRFTSAPNSPNAVIGFGDITGNISNGISTLNIQDITSANASVSDDLPDLIISSVVADPTINTQTRETRPTAVKKTGNGMLELTAANTFTGQVTVSEGVLRLSGDALAVKAPIALEANGTLDLNVAEGAGKAFSGKVTGTGRAVKSGIGTLTLNTANGFEASSLNVSAGRANVVGTLSGDLAIADGAVFSPGDGIGTLTVNGDFAVDDGAKLVFELGADASDLLILGSESTLDIADDAVFELLFADADTSKTYTLIKAEGGWGEYADSAFWTDMLSAAGTANWELAIVGNTLQAFVSADPSVPEPATWALLMLGAAGVFFVRKKRA